MRRPIITSIKPPKYDSFKASCIFLQVSNQLSMCFAQQMHTPLRFDDIYSRCSDYFVAQSLPPPSKNLLSKQIVGLFHPQHFIIREHGERYSAYKSLKIRIPTSTNQSITVLDHCSAIITQNNELKVTCNRKFIVNGRQLSCSVLFGVSKCRSLFLSLNSGNHPGYLSGGVRWGFTTTTGRWYLIGLFIHPYHPNHEPPLQILLI